MSKPITLTRQQRRAFERDYQDILDRTPCPVHGTPVAGPSGNPPRVAVIASSPTDDGGRVRVQYEVCCEVWRAAVRVAIDTAARLGGRNASVNKEPKR